MTHGSIDTHRDYNVALRYGCPFCGVDPGRKCVNQFGDNQPVPHYSRTPDEEPPKDVSGGFYAIGHDLELLCDAVRVVARRKATARTGQGSVQRHVRVGWVKAGRLMILLEHYGVIGPATGTSRVHAVLITEAQVPETVARLRRIADHEPA